MLNVEHLEKVRELFDHHHSSMIEYIEDTHLAYYKKLI